MNNATRIGLIIGISLVISSSILGTFFYITRGPQNTVKVVGMAAKPFEADTVKWTIILEERTTQDALKQGYSRLQASTKRLLDELSTRGIDKGSITVRPINAYAEPDPNGYAGVDRPKVYKLEQTVTVLTGEMATVETMALDPAALLDKGIAVYNSRLEYFYSKLDDLKKEIIAEATANAMERARKMLDGTGATIGKMVSVQSGVFQITEPFSTDVSAYGVYDTSVRRQEIKVTVHVVFEMK